MKRAIGALALAVFVLATAGITTAPTADAGVVHIQVRLHPVGDSGVSGLVDLVQLPNKGGTHIVVVAFGLRPGAQYVSLYYDNHVCRLEPYSADDVIGGKYTALPGGVGFTQGTVEDSLAQINSVSVRRASDFRLVACADVHPG